MVAAIITQMIRQVNTYMPDDSVLDYASVLYKRYMYKGTYENVWRVYNYSCNDCNKTIRSYDALIRHIELCNQN
jgi:hypothetical protein